MIGQNYFFSSFLKRNGIFRSFVPAFDTQKYKNGVSPDLITSTQNLMQDAGKYVAVYFK